MYNISKKKSLIPARLSLRLRKITTQKFFPLANTCFTLAEDEMTKSTVIKSPTKGRNRNGSTTEMAVDQLQASEKLIAGKFHSDKDPENRKETNPNSLL